MKMTYEELAKKIAEMPPEMQQQEAMVYCDDHAAEDGLYSCSLQVGRSGPRIHANIAAGNDDEYEDE